jgi:translation initiation factor IF-2
VRVRQELMAYGLTSEEFGGDTIFVDISAKMKAGIDKLFDMIILQAEVLELKADDKRRAEGFIIESHLNPARGAVATVLITTGTLKVGDIFVAGDISGRVRRMRDEHDQLLNKAGPSRPVELIGLSGAPEAGEHFVVMADERIAREIADKRNFRRRVRQLGERQHVTLENLHDYLEEGKIKELNLVLKGDLQGSLEAIQQSLRKLPAEKVKVNFIHSGVGPINESDVNLAMTTDSIIFGFNIRPEAQANLLAKNKGIDIRLYRVIYDLLGDIERALLGLLEPTYRELFKGRAEVREVFRLSKVGHVAGCFVAEGEMLRGAHGRLMRDSTVVYDGKIASLRRVKDDVAKVAGGLECGVQLENYQDVKEGDIIECYELEELTQGL